MALFSHNMCIYITNLTRDFLQSLSNWIHNPIKKYIIYFSRVSDEWKFTGPTFFQTVSHSKFIANVLEIYTFQWKHTKKHREGGKNNNIEWVCVYVFLVNLTNKQKAQPSWMTSNANSHHWRVELLHLNYQVFFSSLFGTITAQWFNSLFDHSVLFFHIISRKFCRKMANSVNSGVNQLIVHK